MEKRIATLDVIVNDDPQCNNSGLLTPTFEDGNPQFGGRYWITLCPNAKGAASTREGIIDIFAHELGHFIAQVFRLPEHIRNNWLNGHGVDAPKLPSEEQAWTISEKIRPGIKERSAYREGIESYRRHDSLL